MAWFTRKQQTQKEFNSDPISETIKEKLHPLILRTLKQLGKGSFRDIANKANLESVQVARRLSELERKGKVHEVGRKICPISKRWVTEWEVTEN